MAGVAARAGTNKAALYRRWPNRTELLAAAIDRRIVPLAAKPISTGSLRGDVIAVLHAMNQRCRAAKITDRLITEIVDEVFLPLTAYRSASPLPGEDVSAGRAETANRPKPRHPP